MQIDLQKLPNNIKETLIKMGFSENTKIKICETEKYYYIGDEFDTYNTYNKNDLLNLISCAYFKHINGKGQMVFVK